MEDNIDYGAVFGLDTGENGQEVAEPADITESAQGENGQEVAEPVADDITEPTADNEGDAADVEDAATSATNHASAEPQPTDERARFAAARRKAEAERDAAVAQARQDAVQDAQRTINEIFAFAGLTNPYTKQPITTKTEFDEYRARFETEKKSHVLKSSGMSEDEFNLFIENLPQVRDAKQAKVQAEQAQFQAQQARAKLEVDEQLKEICALDPGIKELGDVVKMPTYPRFYELVKKGNTLVDAFKLANMDALTKNAVAVSRQAAINSAQSKQHMSQTASRGKGAVSVPSDIREAYRAFNPNATDAEIQKHYNNYIKE